MRELKTVKMEKGGLDVVVNESDVAEWEEKGWKIAGEKSSASKKTSKKKASSKKDGDGEGSGE